MDSNSPVNPGTYRNRGGSSAAPVLNNDQKGLFNLYLTFRTELLSLFIRGVCGYGYGGDAAAYGFDSSVLVNGGDIGVGAFI